MVKGDPLAPVSHQRAGLRGQFMDLVRSELDVAEDCGPADCGELLGAQRAVCVLGGSEPQRRCGTLA